MSPTSRLTRRAQQRRALDRMMAHRLFHRMMARQGIDLTGGWRRTLEDILLQAVQRCASCAAAPACRRWLASEGSRAGYVTFCPNTSLIETCRILDPNASPLSSERRDAGISHEPDFTEILDDPIIDLIMASDGCDADQLRELVGKIRVARESVEREEQGAAVEEETMSRTLERLRQDHCNTATLLRTLEWQLNEFETCNRPDYEVIAATLDYFLSFPDIDHHPEEELIFAKLRRRDPAAAQQIGDLQQAHRELAARADEFAAALRAVLREQEVSRDAFVRWARGFIDLQRGHIAMEDASFFPAAERALTAQDWIELSATTTRDDRSVGKPIDERFERLRETILTWQAQDQAASAEGYWLNPGPQS